MRVNLGCMSSLAGQSTSAEHISFTAPTRQFSSSSSIRARACAYLHAKCARVSNGDSERQLFVCLSAPLPTSVCFNEPLGCRAHSETSLPHANTRRQEALRRRTVFFLQPGLCHIHRWVNPCPRKSKWNGKLLVSPINPRNCPPTHMRTNSFSACVSVCTELYLYPWTAERLGHVFLSQIQGQVAITAPNTFKVKATVVAEEPREVYKNHASIYFFYLICKRECFI